MPSLNLRADLRKGICSLSSNYYIRDVAYHFLVLSSSIFTCSTLAYYVQKGHCYLILDCYGLLYKTSFVEEEAFQL